MNLLVYTHTRSNHFNTEIVREIYEKTECFVAAESNVFKVSSNTIPAGKLIELRGRETAEINLREGKNSS